MISAKPPHARPTLDLFEPLFAKTLADTRQVADRLLLQRRQAIARQAEALTQARIRQLRAMQDDYQAKIRHLEQLQQNLRDKLLQRWAGDTVTVVQPKNAKKRFVLSESDIPQIQAPSPKANETYADALHLLDAALSRLDVGKPILASTKGVLWQEEVRQVAEALRAASSALHGLIQAIPVAIGKEFDGFQAALLALRVEGSARAADENQARRAATARGLGTLSGSIGEGIPAAPDGVTPGHGRLLFQCGWTAHTALLRVAGVQQAYGASTPSVVDLELAPLTLPLMIDLVEEHGFATSDDLTIKSFILRMLHTLPAGSVTLSVYDPTGMGDFVSYLYPLGDKQERVLGKNGVLTTQKQLQDLLEEIERHIGVINQKYLAGKYPDLVAYNRDAGVTFEPYRLLVINDSPRGWEQSYRQELMGQLARIVDAGAKCGVFVLVKESTPYPQGLPVLVPGRCPTSRYAPSPTTPAPVTQMSLQQLLSAGGAGDFYAVDEVIAWVPSADSWIDPAGVTRIISTLERDLDQAGTVAVDPASVAAIARQYRAVQAAKGIPDGPPVLDPGNPAGWWRESSTGGVAAYVGIDKANQKKPRIAPINETQTAFGALVGGQPGSGKSTFLHAMILELARRYAPAELELYLIDVKFGVEFKPYATGRLPHAKVVALESGAEFAVAMLEELIAEMGVRYAHFRAAGVSNLDDYKQVTNRAMPRVLAIVDEFSGIWEADTTHSQRATQCLTQLIQQGRAAGIHLVLASQSLSTASFLPRQVLQQIPQRIVFALPDADSRLILDDTNPKAAELDRPGEGIFNSGNGRLDKNEAFQGTLIAPDDIRSTLRALASLATAKGLTRAPVVLEHPGAAAWTRQAFSAAKQGVSGLSISVPIGLPMSLEPPVVVPLRQTKPGNALICIQQDDTFLNVVSAFLIGPVFAGADVALLDFSDPSSVFVRELAVHEQALSAAFGARFKVFRGPRAYPVIGWLKERAARALTGAAPLKRPTVVVVCGLALAHELNQVSAVAGAFAELLDASAGAGMHVVVATDSLATAKSRLGWSALDSFSTVITGQCGQADSMELVQSYAASQIEHDQQVIVYARSGTARKARPFRAHSFNYDTR